jgi:hypothetical protein
MTRNPLIRRPPRTAVSSPRSDDWFTTRCLVGESVNANQGIPKNRSAINAKQEIPKAFSFRKEYLSDAELAVGWPAPGSEDIELGVLMEPEVGHGETEVYARVQA